MSSENVGNWILRIGAGIIVALCFWMACGCRTGQAIHLHNCQGCTIKLDSGSVVNSKETPFDILRGFGQGATVPVGQTASATISGAINTQGK